MYTFLSTHWQDNTLFEQIRSISSEDIGIVVVGFTSIDTSIIYNVGIIICIERAAKSNTGGGEGRLYLFLFTYKVKKILCVEKKRRFLCRKRRWNACETIEYCSVNSAAGITSLITDDICVRTANRWFVGDNIHAFDSE